MNLRFLLIGMVIAVGMGVGMIQGEKKLDALNVVANAVAKTNCSCVFVAGRDLSECVKDAPPGFDLATPWIDHEAQAVSSSIYWIVRGTARYQDGVGCRLE